MPTIQSELVNSNRGGSNVSGEAKSTRIEALTNGRKAAKDIAKSRVRRHERDADHDLMRRYNSGQRSVDDR